MSGIFGIIDRTNAAIAPSCFAPMGVALAHRGPDGVSQAAGPGYALGHCLLQTAGNGPAMGQLLHEDGFTATADCRLDNRDELCTALAMPDGCSDTALLLRGYRRWGADVPTHLLGDFAFAIWNEADGTLFCARDHFGVKPFYYHDDTRHFLFASELTGIFATGLAPRQVVDDRIGDFLGGVSPAPDLTSYRSLYRLPPGQSCTISRDGRETMTYWALPLSVPRPRADAPGEFRQRLGQAVACRLRGGPAGAMLSGGLDSSAIACLAATTAGGGAPLPTFSIVFDQTPELNERPFVEAVLAPGGFAPHFIASDNVPPFANFDQVLAEQQDLFLGTNLASSRQVYHAARQAGIKVLLDGHGGDEVAIVGAGRLHELAAAGRWLTLWREVSGGLQEADESRFSAFWLLFSHYGVARHVLRAKKSLRRRLGLARRGVDPTAGFINPDFAARQKKIVGRPKGAAFSESAWHHEVLTGPLQSYVFEILDRLAAHAGVEARYPFWDKRLVEFCLSLESREKLEAGWGRAILRRGMAGVLPEKIRWRRGKFDFKNHIAAALVRNHTDLVDQVLADEAGVIGGYVALPALRAAFDRLRHNVARADGYELQIIWRAVVLAGWLAREQAARP